MKNTVLILAFLGLSACAGKYNIKSSEAAMNYVAHTAHVINQGGNSKDMDTHVSRALMVRGLKVTDSESVANLPKTDILVKYTDSWQWDITMYLRAVDITFYDRSGNILASGNYTNSFFHEWPNEGQVVQKVVDDMFAKLGITPGKRQASNPTKP
ncbi:hypothetical protein [Bdellovibrio sp. ZAP7]|uniref:hypothetical protein n=1 Tax=Bdellovibrio sp. ZAP7 TaxID=2231053 RepID=UPI0011589EBA|nr:hypothetical protein [Bdellovibrio sp. ZAP7]